MPELVPVTVENGATVMLNRDYAESVGYSAADVEVSRTGKIIDPVVGGYGDKSFAELGDEIKFRNALPGREDSQIPLGKSIADRIAALEADDAAQDPQ